MRYRIKSGYWFRPFLSTIACIVGEAMVIVMMAAIAMADVLLIISLLN